MDKEADMSISLLTKAGVLNKKDNFKISKVVKTKDIKTQSDDEATLLNKISKYLERMYKASQEESKDAEDAESLNLKHWTKLINTLAENMDHKVCSVTTSSQEGTFDKNCNKGYNKMKKVVDKTMKPKINKNDYVDLNEQLKKLQKTEEKKDDPQINAKNKIAKDIKEGKNGDLLHLEAITNALKTPIQVQQDGKIWQEIGNEFSGDPLKLLYKNGDWLSPNGYEKGSVYDLIGKALYPDSSDASETIKKMVMAAVDNKDKPPK